MAVRLRIYGTDRLPPGIPLKHPILTAAPNREVAAKVLKVSVYHLERHPLPILLPEDRERALAHPGERLLAGGSE